RLGALETEACPTCGTHLTDEHRRTVEQTYAEERAVLEAEVARVEVQKGEKERAVEALRGRYRELATAIGRHNGVAADLAEVQGRIASIASAAESLEVRRERLTDLDRQLRDDAFRPDLRAERTELTEELRDLPFDPERFEAVQAEAAQRERYE